MASSNSMSNHDDNMNVEPIATAMPILSHGNPTSVESNSPGALAVPIFNAEGNQITHTGFTVIGTSDNTVSYDLNAYPSQLPKTKLAQLPSEEEMVYAALPEHEYCGTCGVSTIVFCSIFGGLILIGAIVLLTLYL